MNEPRLEQVARLILETFRRDEAQGYRSRDRQFAIALLAAVLDQSQAAEDENSRLNGLNSSIAGMIENMADGHYQRGLNGFHAYQDWAGLANEIRGLRPFR